MLVCRLLTGSIRNVQVKNSYRFSLSKKKFLVTIFSQEYIILAMLTLERKENLLLFLLDFQETVKFGGFSRTVHFCHHEFKNVSKAGIHVSTEINLFKAFRIIAITPRCRL